jgi:AcrR family transcriptional regulator
LARRSDHTRAQLHQMALSAARELVQADGLRGLSTRAIAAKLGYSPGTLYQIFSDIDDIIQQLNSATLEALYVACNDVDLANDPEQALDDLAERYIGFVQANPNLWSALFDHKLPPGKLPSKAYSEEIDKLFGLAEAALGPLLQNNTKEQKSQHAHVLWASLYGIASLASAQKLGPGADPMAMVKMLVANYLGGLQA